MLVFEHEHTDVLQHDRLDLTDHLLEGLEVLAPPAPDISSFSDCRCGRSFSDKIGVLRYGLNLLQIFLFCNNIKLTSGPINLDRDWDDAMIRDLAREKFEELKYKIHSVYSEAVESNSHIYRTFERHELQMATFMLFEATWFYQNLCGAQKKLVKSFFREFNV